MLLYYNDYLRSALLRLESDNMHESQKLRTDLEQITNKLRAYEVLEEEIDGAIMRTAAINGAKNSPNVDHLQPDAYLYDTVEASANKLLLSVKGIPTNPERRVKQAVYLAQRLMEAERQRDELQHHLVELKKELSEAKQQTQIAIDNLSRSAQPTSYLVGKLREEETSKSVYLNKCKSLEQELQISKKNEMNKNKEIQQLRERLKSILQQRGELETVKVMLAQLHAIENVESDESDDDNNNNEEESQEHQISRNKGIIQNKSVPSQSYYPEHKSESNSNLSSSPKHNHQYSHSSTANSPSVTRDTTTTTTTTTNVDSRLFPSSPPQRDLVATAASVG